MYHLYHFRVYNTVGSTTWTLLCNRSLELSHLEKLNVLTKSTFMPTEQELPFSPSPQNGSRCLLPVFDYFKYLISGILQYLSFVTGLFQLA